MSCRGPSGRGVNSESQPPQTTLQSGSSRRRSSSVSVVLPIPASPPTRAMAPWPPSARSLSAMSRASGSSLSTSKVPPFESVLRSDDPKYR